MTNNTNISILTTSSLFCNSSLLHYSSALFILGLTCCLFLSILSLSFSCFLICAHSALFTFSLLFSLCSLSLSFLHIAHTVVLPFYSSTHFSVRTTNIAQSLCFYFMHTTTTVTLRIFLSRENVPANETPIDQES